jgi:REP element-mobilizing transposase RayT
MRRKIKPTVDNYYHIYNRGVNYQNIFFNQENWLFFLRLLRRYCTPDKAAIIAYCLMPNHYHILSRSKWSSHPQMRISGRLRTPAPLISIY